VDGRPELASELDAVDSDMAAYVRESIRNLLSDEDFIDALPGFLPGDAASQQRLPALRMRLMALAG
jgi:hypothetical protein